MRSDQGLVPHPVERFVLLGAHLQVLLVRQLGHHDLMAVPGQEADDGEGEQDQEQLSHNESFLRGLIIGVVKLATENPTRAIFKKQSRRKLKDPYFYGPLSGIPSVGSWFSGP